MTADELTFVTGAADRQLKDVDDLRAPSGLDLVRAFIRTREERHITLEHPDVPEVTLVCRVPSDGNEVSTLRDRFEKRAGKKSGSEHGFNRILLAHFTTEIRINDITLELDDEQATFSSRALWAELDATSASEACKALLGSDFVIAALSGRLIEESGISAQVEVTDPTQAL